MNESIKWLSSWLAEQEDRGSIPGLATWIFRDWLSPASKSRYGWKIAKSTLILKTTNQQSIKFCEKRIWSVTLHIKRYYQGAAVVEWLSSWLAKQWVRGSIPCLATWISENGSYFNVAIWLKDCYLKRLQSKTTQRVLPIFSLTSESNKQINVSPCQVWMNK